ncbi:hypothetical protein I7I53_07325 [Histoplasma capsulatum var. duboisii H88]|uniref:Uncharacterized protein n=2 Tax=Ajellomyces capsulatus TaxID=5037 RepID=A0A8H8D7A3_AJECA|nr:hypothetical protein I7I52_02526 [Histoplasma capsulatum]QSS51876.1 hypothetical protein I7I53_07325 [Histoplasma capsulatum var. duboisii H88]QSS69859.1 hypothetical protein I7I50_11288 [Histoplasma capsulatum G186AR]
MSLYRLVHPEFGAASPFPTVKNVALIPSAVRMSIICRPNSREPSSIPNANEFGRLHRFHRDPVGSFLGAGKFSGLVAVISTFDTFNFSSR